MIYNILVLIGIFIGILTAYLAKEELKEGNKYFIILEIFLLISLVIIAFYFEFNFISFLIGIPIGFVMRKEYFYFGILLSSNAFTNNTNFLLNSLSLIYGIPYGTLIFYNKEYRELIISLILFLIVFILLYFTGLSFVSFAGSALLAIAIMKTAKLKSLFE